MEQRVVVVPVFFCSGFVHDVLMNQRANSRRAICSPVGGGESLLERPIIELHQFIVGELRQ
jgi:hypothetical protein